MLNAKTPKFLIISGPTASGKSALALKIAEKFPARIINADASQLYKDLPILSCQPSKEDQAKAQHCLYSILNFNEKSSVTAWLEMVRSEVLQCLEHNELPIIVGGTGMYISKLLNGICEIPEISSEVKKEVDLLYTNSSLGDFKTKLIALGEKEELVLKLDKQRLLRSFDVIKQTGKPISWWQQQPNKKIFPDANYLHINLEPERQKLYQRCNSRFELLIKSGAVEEVENLLKLDLSEDSSITKTIGFSEIASFLDGKIDFEEMIEKSSQDTRNYAKRQLTWFRNQFVDKLVVDAWECDLQMILDRILAFYNISHL